jgi:uncharacterized membrane protein
MLIPVRPTHGRSLAKAVSWRILASLDTFLLGFVITGNYRWAGFIALSEVATKIGLFYAHERFWSFVKWGYTKEDRRAATPPG